MNALYIDDLTETVAVNLKKQVVNDTVQRTFTLNFQILPAGSILQKNFINTNVMKIIIFNTSRKYDVPPELCFVNGDILDCVEETKLLGFLIDSSLNWH